VTHGFLVHSILRAARNGPSATRSFLTALNTACFDALDPSRSIRLISLMDRPS
jgi:hypothetical protein